MSGGTSIARLTRLVTDLRNVVRGSSSPSSGKGVFVPTWYGDLYFYVYFDGLKAPLEVLQHFISAICSLINSPSKLRRINDHVAKGTFASVSLKPFDSLLDLLATFKARNFQR